MATSEKSPVELEKSTALAHVPRCEEYEKMISGMLYNSFVPELDSARFKARAWAHKYNHYFPDDPEATPETLGKARLEMLRQRLGRIADDECYIEPPFNIDYGCNISIGKRFYSNFQLTILDVALVTIGDRVMMGPNVVITTATHEVEVASRRENIEFGKPVTIGDDCWIGGAVVILPGVTIGEGCTIGASSVVTRDIPAWSVALGSPARVVKKVTPLDKIE